MNILIAGAGGHAREIADVISHMPDVFVFEEFDTGLGHKWRNTTKFVRTYSEIENIFSLTPEFIIGVGDPSLREYFFNKLIKINGIPENVVAPTSLISSSNVTLGVGLNIMSFVFISNNVEIGDGTLINTGCRIHHDCNIGKFSQISPNVTITGNCTIGDKCSIGASATILPNISIGNNVIIGAGSLVTRNIEDNQIVVGVPAKPKK